RSGEGNDDVVGTADVGGAVGRHHRGLRPVLQVGGSSLGEGRFDLQAPHISVGAHQLRQDGRVVAAAGADLEDAFSGLNSKGIEVTRPQAGLAVVQSL